MDENPQEETQTESFLTYIMAVVIPDAFMELITWLQDNQDFDDSWDLIDPHTQQVVKTV